MTRSTNSIWIVPAAMLALLAGNTAMAGDDAMPGASKAAPCLACHKADAFAGLDQATIVDAINAVASGKKPHPPVGSPTSQDVADIAAYFASQTKAGM